MIKRPKLSRSKTTEEAPANYKSHLAAPISETADTETARDHIATATKTLGRGAKVLIGTALFTVFILVAIHTALAGSLMFTASTDDRPMTERVWVARGTFVGGQIDSGTQVYGSASSLAADDFLGKVKEGYLGSPDYYIATVIAGPVATVENGKDNKILVNGKDSGYTGKVEKTNLRNQFLAECIEGACTPGEFIYADYASIAGEVNGVIYPFGIKKISGTQESPASHDSK